MLDTYFIRRLRSLLIERIADETDRIAQGGMDLACYKSASGYVSGLKDCLKIMDGIGSEDASQ